jgi:phage terminase small subunit
MAMGKQKEVKKFKKLTNKEKLFVQEYLIDLDVERAALAAGFSKTMAASKAYQWVRNSKVKPQVCEAIRKAFKKREERTEITQDRVLEEYAKLAFLDPRKFYDADGNLLAIPDLPKDVAAALSGMDVTISFNKESESLETIKKIKFSDKKAALDSVAKHLGMFEKHQNQGAATIVINSTDIKKPANAGTGKD